MIVENKITEITQRIVDVFDPHKIILFGSYAHGEPTLDSDVEILIVMDSDERPAARTTRISGLLRPRPFPIDILVRTPEEIQRRIDLGDYFIHEVLEQGKVLYERNPI